MVKVINPFNKSEEECCTVANYGCACDGTYAKGANKALAFSFGGCYCSCHNTDAINGTKASAKD